MKRTEQKKQNEANERPEGRSKQPAEAVELSEEAAALVRDLEAERDQAIAARQRALADFQNYQRRAAQSERRAAASGAAGIVRSILPVLDHFDLALSQKPRELTVEQLFGGVKIVRDELSRALEANGVERLEPERGECFDPIRHEAMLHQHTDEVESGHIVSVLQPGYIMDEQVLRPAKVAVAAAEDSRDDDAEAEGQPEEQ